MKMTTPSGGLFNVMKESLSLSIEKNSRRKGSQPELPREAESVARLRNITHKRQITGEIGLPKKNMIPALKTIVDSARNAFGCRAEATIIDGFCCNFPICTVMLEKSQ